MFIIISVAVIGVFLLISVDHKLTVTRYRIETDKLDAPVRIALLSDLHSGFHGENQEVLISMLDEQKPDIVLLGGDIDDDFKSHHGAIKLLDGITDKYDCIYVTGNHEARGDKVAEIKALFRERGVVILEGENRVVEINGQRLNIFGIDDPQIGEEIFQKQLEQLESAIDSIDDGLYTIFLSHRPELFDNVLTKKLRYDLLLAGHTHGGQLRIPRVLEGVYSPGQGIFPEYTSGLYMSSYSEHKKMIVSTGLATNHPIVIPRVFNPPEIVITDLIPE